MFYEISTKIEDGSTDGKNEGKKEIHLLSP